jgi:hypothetical protein
VALEAALDDQRRRQALAAGGGADSKTNLGRCSGQDVDDFGRAEAQTRVAFTQGSLEPLPGDFLGAQRQWKGPRRVVRFLNIVHHVEYSGGAPVSQPVRFEQSISATTSSATNKGST